MTRATLAAAALAVLLALAAAGPGRAGTMVLAASSRAVKDRYPPGGALPAGPLRLAAGEWLQVLADGKVMRLQGPLAARAKATTPQEASLFARIKAAVDQIEARPVELGAVRAGPGPVNPWAINVARGGDVCVLAGASVELWRRSATAAETYVLIPPGGPPRTVPWPAGADTAAWPADLAVQTGTYVLRDGAGLERVIALHVIPAATAPADTLAALSDARCFVQAARRIAEAS